MTCNPPAVGVTPFPAVCPQGLWELLTPLERAVLRACRVFGRDPLVEGGIGSFYRYRASSAAMPAGAGTVTAPISFKTPDPAWVVALDTYGILVVENDGSTMAPTAFVSELSFRRSQVVLVSSTTVALGRPGDGNERFTDLREAPIWTGSEAPWSGTAVYSGPGGQPPAVGVVELGLVSAIPFPYRDVLG